MRTIRYVLMIFLLTPRFVDASQILSECEDEQRKVFPWQINQGNKNFNINIYADISVYRQCDDVGSEMIANAKATVFGKNIEVFESRIAAESNLENAHLKHSVMVMGYELDAGAEDASFGNSMERQWSYPLNYQLKKRVMVGPIPFSISIGIIGEVVLPAKLRANVLKVGLYSYPTVSAEAFLIGGIAEKEIISATTSGRVDLLIESLDLRAESYIRDYWKEKPTLFLRARGSNSFVTLRGVAEAEVITLDEQIWRKEFFAQPGFSDNRQLFYYKKKFVVDRDPTGN